MSSAEAPRFRIRMTMKPFDNLFKLRTPLRFHSSYFFEEPVFIAIDIMNGTRITSSQCFSWQCTQWVSVSYRSNGAYINTTAGPGMSGDGIPQSNDFVQTRCALSHRIYRHGPRLREPELTDLCTSSVWKLVFLEHFGKRNCVSLEVPTQYTCSPCQRLF